MDDLGTDTIDPTDLGGTPTQVPSNNVFSDLGSSLVGDVEVLAQTATTRAATSGALAGSTANPPPGQAGKNPAANTVPGGLATISNDLTKALSGTAAGGPGGVLPLLIAGFLVWKFIL